MQNLNGPMHETAHSPFMVSSVAQEEGSPQAALAPPGVLTPGIGLSHPSHQWARHYPLDPGDELIYL
jgi:hypothetical protein